MNFPTEKTLADIIEPFTAKLLSELDNCDFPSGTGDDAKSMRSTQLCVLEYLVEKYLERHESGLRIVFLNQIMSKVLAGLRKRSS